MKKIILIMSLMLFSFNTFALSQQEKNDLIFMYQEEKLAHDVYAQFYKIYNNKVFGNIAKSELKHMSEIENLLKYYKIEVPNLKEGEFQNKELQKLYLDLLNQGKKSKVEAFKVGVLIEDKDIFASHSLHEQKHGKLETTITRVDFLFQQRFIRHCAT